jgi:hypothetical protein
MLMKIALSFALSGAALLHVLWAFRIWFPLGDEVLLARAAVGARGITRMPGPVPCGIVAVLLAGVMLIVWWPAGTWRDVALGLAAFGFIGRGVLTWTPLMDRLCPEQPFRRLNRQFYGPLILMIGVGLAAQALHS